MINFITENAPVIGLLVFFSIFCIVVIILFRPKAKKKFQKYANIPLKDDEPTIRKK